MTTFDNYVNNENKINPVMLDKLKEINNRYTKHKNAQTYANDICLLFSLKQKKQLNDKEIAFFAGFVEGEGSINVGAKKTKFAVLGLCIDPEFNITQSIFGVQHLYNALVYFKTGRLSYKSGSNATLVFRIDNRKTLKEIVIPFYKNYVVPFSSDKKIERFNLFSQLLDYFDLGYHLELTTMIEHILPLWDQMRLQQGQSNETFASIQEAKDYIINHVKDKDKV